MLSDQPFVGFDIPFGHFFLLVRDLNDFPFTGTALAGFRFWPRHGHGYSVSGYGVRDRRDCRATDNTYCIATIVVGAAALGYAFWWKTTMTLTSTIATIIVVVVRRIASFKRRQQFYRPSSCTVLAGNRRRIKSRRVVKTSFLFFSFFRNQFTAPRNGRARVWLRNDSPPHCLRCRFSGDKSENGQ